ncbi:hypothetical protein ABIF96_005790 [Bradyrhizobium ottawaense]|uniref:hypothetical protein n=1 Tax=Bradyrhizobium ottawaense TaxID=931866 RepID=UPI00383235DA
MSDGTTTATTTDTTAATTTATDTASTTATAAATTTDATTTATTTAAAATDTTATTAAASTDWRSTITDPEHVEFAKRLTSPADAVKVALDLRKANSAMIRVPGKDATAEDRAKFNKAIGVPEKAEDYKFDLGREPTEADKAIQAKIAAVALEHGVPANAMAGISKAVAEMAQAAKDEENRVAVAAREANEAALRKEWGADYEANKTLASRAVQAFGEVKSHPEVIELFEKTIVNGQKLGDHPVMLRMLGNIGRRMGEGEFIGAVGADQRSSLQSELNEIMTKNPPGSVGYRDAAVQKRIGEINEALHGNGGIVGVAGRSA